MKKVLTAVLLGAMMLIASFAGAQVVTSAQGFTVTAPVALVAQVTNHRHKQVRPELHPDGLPEPGSSER